jgi:hypothetical protein
MRKAMHSFLSKSRFRSMMILGLVGIFDINAVQADGPGKVQDGLQVSESDWPWWRGPRRNGEAASNQTPPVAWDDAKNVAWKTAIPGRGYGSVCLHGDKAFLLTSDESSGSQSVLCLDRQTGKVVWTKVGPCAGRNAEERKVNLRIQHTGLRWFAPLCLLSESRGTLGQRTRSRRLHRMAKEDQSVCRTPRIRLLAGALPIVS